MRLKNIPVRVITINEEGWQRPRVSFLKDTGDLVEGGGQLNATQPGSGGWTVGRG